MFHPWSPVTHSKTVSHDVPSLTFYFEGNTYDNSVAAVVDFGSRAFRDHSESPILLGVGGLTLLWSARRMISKKLSNLIDTICNRTYIYNICWEDPAIDHQVLKIQPDDVIFRICSAGDIVLDYAIEGPQKIVICDLNQHQLWLFELKIMMLRDPKLTYEEWWGIWASSDVRIALSVWQRMRHTMSKGGREWWDGRLERVFRNGYATSGSCGFVTKMFLPVMLRAIGFDLQCWAATGFSHDYVVSRLHIIDRSARWFRYLFPKVLAPFAGVPPNQMGPEFHTSEHYGKVLRKIFLDPDFHKSNYFYRFYLEQGYKDPNCCPRTLKREHFESLRENAGCFEWHHATVQETMERVKPNSFTKLVLLDHMDWMSNEIIHDEWVALQRASKPGARVLWRSALLSHTQSKPFFNNLDITDLTPEWYEHDRVKMYPGTFTCLMPSDPIPFIETNLSKCQVAGTTRKLYTTTKMILHPVFKSLTFFWNSNDHGSRMSSFYATQARGYDAVREHMLVSRPSMMSGFGPIKLGHTWLDVGGGTGRNLHYLRAQLDLFERIVVLDICPELLEIGQLNASKSFTKEQCSRISWLCLDVNSPDIAKHLVPLMSQGYRGFDTVSFSYSLSMIPEWQKALLTARNLLSEDGRVIVSDFDTYTENGRGIKDWMLRTWYRQDGVRISADSRYFMQQLFGDTNRFAVTTARFQRKICGVSIPHYVACCRKTTVTTNDGKRRPSTMDLSDMGEEKKTD